MSLSRNHNTVPGDNPQTLLWAVLSELFFFQHHSAEGSSIYSRLGLHPNVWTVRASQTLNSVNKGNETDFTDWLNYHRWIAMQVKEFFFLFFYSAKLNKLPNITSYLRRKPLFNPWMAACFPLHGDAAGWSGFLRGDIAVEFFINIFLCVLWATNAECNLVLLYSREGGPLCGW